MFSDWISDYNQIIQWAGIVSVFLFFLSLFLLRYVILRLPEDYFITASSISKSHSKSPQKIIVRVAKNAVGFLLTICGIILLFTPGQGMITILIGFCLIDLAIVNQFKKKIINNRKVQKALNWIRTKKSVKPFNFPKC